MTQWQIMGALSDIATVDWAVCIGYLLVVLSLGVWFSRSQKTNDDFFLGGRNMHWLPVGLSLFATTFSSNSFVGLPAEGAFGDYHQLLAILFIPFIVLPITCYWFIPFYKRLGFVSLYEYLERRFDRRIRLFASAVFMFYSAGWMATMLLAVSRILEVVLETDSTSHTLMMIAMVGFLATIYTAVGGVKAVIWTDTIQAFALGGGMLVLLFFLVSQIQDGWTGLLEVAREHNKTEMLSTRPGWGQRNIYSACAYGFFIYLGGQIGTYGAFQRYVTVDTIRDARRSLAVKGIFILFVCTLFFVVGTALFAFYQQTAETTGIFDYLNDGRLRDRLLPHFVVTYAGGYGMTGLLLAGLFAAAMSSLDSGINSMTATLVTDWLHGREVGTRSNRCLTLMFGVVVTAGASILVMVDLPVFDILLSIAGASYGLLLGVLLMGMFSSRANVTGVIAGMISGVLMFAFIRIYTGVVSPEQLQWMGGLAEIRANTWWDGMFTTVTTILVGMTVSYCTRRPTSGRLAGMLLLPERREVATLSSSPRVEGD